MKKIDSIIQEQINKLIENNQISNQQLGTLIESIVNKQVDNLIVEKTSTKKSKKNSKDSKVSQSKKKSVLAWLQQPEVNAAEIRRKLEGEPESQEEEDTKRSYFMKKVNQTHGKKFTTSEINGLYSIKNKLG